LFQGFDTNKDGVLTSEEINGKLDWEAFARLMVKVEAIPTADATGIRSIQNVIQEGLDKLPKGVLSKDEFTALVMGMRHNNKKRQAEIASELQVQKQLRAEAVRMQADAELLRSAQKVQKKRAPMPDWAGAGGAEEVGAFTVTGAAANRMHKRSPPKLDPNDPEVLLRNRPSIPAQALAKFKQNRVSAGIPAETFLVTAGAKKRMARIPTLRRQPWQNAQTEGMDEDVDDEDPDDENV
jgi:hypothetical protein